MDPVTAIGLLAGFLTTLSSLPQVIKSFKTKKTRDLSLGWVVLILSGVSLWLVYGILVQDLPLIATNSISMVLLLVLLVLKMKFG